MQERPVTKNQLRWDRRHALNSWLAARATDMTEALFWNPVLAAAELVRFGELDAIYQTAKAALARELKTLSVREWAVWCAGIGWTPTGATQSDQVDDYLARA